MKTEIPASGNDPLYRNTVWRTCQFLLRIGFSIWLRYRARGFEKLAELPGALLLINHQSYLDPLLVGLPLKRPVSFLARDSLFRIPIVGWILKNTYVMPINRESASSASIREALRRMELGFLVGIFPEGARTLDGQVGEFKPGFLALARRTNKPIIPVGIAGGYSALRRGSLILWPATVRVVFGDPIPPEELARYRGKDQEPALIEMVRQRVIACSNAAEDWRQGRENLSPPHIN